MEESQKAPSTMELVKLLIEVDRPSHFRLRGLNRARKHLVLKENTNEKRAGIISWLYDNHLTDQVKGISDSTPFNLIFMEATENVAALLYDAPGVRSVSHVDKIEVKLQQIK